MRLRHITVVLALLATLLVTPTAGAEVLHPRQQWLRESTAGLFLHWGMFTSPRHLDCAAWERDVTEGGWTADYWVEEARKLGASYIVLATFHSRLGYARPWPSNIPGSCRTERDLLGELVDAGNAKGVRTILYMTDDPQWHSEQGIQTLDSAAYSAYKGEPVDLTTRDGFGRYSYDLFFEVMDRYDDLAGFWIDNDNKYWEDNQLYEKIRERRPSWLLSNNNEDTPIMDTVSNEQKTGMTPSYDYPQAAFTPMPRLTEACYKLPTTGQWWFDGTDHAVDFRLSTGRFITNAGTSMKSLMAETPMVNGKMPPQQEAFNNFMANWLPPIRHTLEKAEGGGYMHGGMQPGFWNDGAHGTITVKQDLQYVHVLTQPRGKDLIRLRDNGYWVTGVTDARTGERMRFHQSGGYLSILGIQNWDTYDTVFEVRTAGQHFRHDQITATADGQPAPALVDGSFPSFWDGGNKLPVSLTLDLGKRRPAAYLAVNQTEWSPTYARESFGRPEDSARIKDYRVFVSNDGVHWGQPVRVGAMRSARGTQFVDIGSQHARYVKLDVLNTWGGPQAPRFYRQLKIDEIKVGYGYPFSFWNRLPYEAEANSRSGIKWCAACSGLLKVAGDVTYRNVQVAEAGDYRLQLDYTAAGTSNLSVQVNGGAAVNVAAVGDNADVPASRAIPVSLRQGVNTIKVSTTAAALDRIAVTPMPPASYVPRTTLRVEPGGVQWVGPGQQSIEVSAELRLDDDEVLDGVKLAPTVPAGWSVTGDAVTAPSLRLGQTVRGSWTVTSPAGQDVTTVQIPLLASYQLLGRPQSVSRSVQVRLRPADRVFMREAEDSRNGLGSSGITNCGPCSGGQKVRNIGGSSDAYVLFENVTVPAAGQRTLFIDFTVNGDRSFFVTVNGGPPIQVPVSGVGNNTPYTTSVPVTLKAGPNMIKLHNDTDAAPDLDRLSLN